MKKFAVCFSVAPSTASALPTFTHFDLLTLTSTVIFGVSTNVLITFQKWKHVCCNVVILSFATHVNASKQRGIGIRSDVFKTYLQKMSKIFDKEDLHHSEKSSKWLKPPHKLEKRKNFGKEDLHQSIKVTIFFYSF